MPRHDLQDGLGGRADAGQVRSPPRRHARARLCLQLQLRALAHRVFACRVAYKLRGDDAVLALPMSEAERQRLDAMSLEEVVVEIRAAGGFAFSKGSSAYRGVCWHKGQGNWKAGIKVAGKQQTVGSFDDEEEAARAYDAAARRVHGRCALQLGRLPSPHSLIAIFPPPAARPASTSRSLTARQSLPPLPPRPPPSHPPRRYPRAPPRPSTPRSRRGTHTPSRSPSPASARGPAAATATGAGAAAAAGARADPRRRRPSTARAVARGPRCKLCYSLRSVQVCLPTLPAPLQGRTGPGRRKTRRSHPSRTCPLCPSRPADARRLISPPEIESTCAAPQPPCN